MSSPSLLLTSFTTWKPEQSSNASDDLLLHVLSQQPQLRGLNLLRKLPVDFQQAPNQAIQGIRQHRPDAIICCGMGETRSHLCIEDRASHDHRIRYTGVNVNRLVSGLSITRVSHDAGQFVCNRLYFEVLDYLQHQGPECPCIFVHVPVLTEANVGAIASDFKTILLRMQMLANRSLSHPMPMFSLLPA